MTFVNKHQRLSFSVLAFIMLAVGLFVGMKFHQPHVKPDAKVQSPTVPENSTLTKNQEVQNASPARENAEEPLAPVSEQSASLSTGDAGEPVYEAIPGAESIAMLTGPELVVVPADPNKPRAEQVEWRYIPLFRIDEAKYDSEKRILICRIDARLSAQTKDRVYTRLREITGAPVQTAFRLNPVRLQSLTVELTVLEKKYVLRSESSGHDIANGPIPVLYRVTDDDLHELLSTNLRDLTLTLRSTHPYAAFSRHTMQIESSMTAAREAFEKVLPKGMKLEDLERHPLIVDRDSMLQLQQALREEFRLRIEGDPAKFAGLDKVLENLLDRVMVSKIPLHELTREMTDNFVIWDSRTARLDVSPSERTTMTNELEEAIEKRSAFKHAWDTMREEAQKTNDQTTWHKTLLDKMRLDAKLKVGIGIFSGSASMNLEKEHAESDQGMDQALRETFQKMKNSGEMSQETFEKSYRKFKGEDFFKSAAGKILNLQRVTNLNVLSFRSALLEHVARMGKGMLERVTFLPLERSDTQQADALRQIELVSTELLTAKSVFQDEIKQLRTDLANAKEALAAVTSAHQQLLEADIALSKELGKVVWVNEQAHPKHGDLRIISFLRLLAPHVEGSGPNWEVLHWKTDIRQ